MAEIKSFPNNQDVYVGAEWVMKWLHGRTSGVFGAEGNLATSIVPDSMSIEVSDGVGWMSNENGDGVVFWNDSEQTSGSKLTLTHDVADGVLDRIDRIVVTWETTNYVALPTISVLKGTASSAPVPPELTNNNIQRQISLAKVNIPAGTVSLLTSMITDERLDPTVCGIVTERVSVDTSMINSQVSELIEKLKNELEGVESSTAWVLKTGDTMTGPLDMSENRITGLGYPVDDKDAASKEYADKAARKASSAYNYLDNSDFTNPVNQRGGTSYSGARYGIDRWKGHTSLSVVTVEDGFVKFSSTGSGQTRQYLDLSKIRPYGKTFTLAYEDTDGNVHLGTGTAPESAPTSEIAICATGEGSGIMALLWDATAGLYVRIVHSRTEMSVRWVALYEGEYTAETLPEYRPKGYGMELLECQRYYQIRSTNNVPVVDLRPVMRSKTLEITSVSDGFAYSADL